MNRKKDILIYAALIIAFLIPRIPKIDSFVTLDEPSWLSQGANFYYALGQREFQNTVYEYQPAVTTMWIISFAMLAYFPEYRGFGQGYLDYEKGKLDPFMIERGYDPLVLLEYSRLTQVFVLLALFLLLYYLLQRFIPKLSAAFVMLFAAFDPFHLGHSRLLTHEAMVSFFVLISLMALAVYLVQDRKIIYLLISGAAAGFAQLSKSSAIAMLGAVGVLLLMQLFQERGEGLSRGFIKNTKIFLLWLVFLAATYFIFWPGMWVAPGKMLYEVYGNAFSYALQGARLKITEDLNVSRFSLSNMAGVWEMTSVLLYRMTPFTWLGILFGFSLPFTRDRELVRPNRVLFSLLLTNAIAFILLIGMAQGRNSPHYILSSYLSLNLLAGLGWLSFLNWLAARFSSKPLQFQSAGLIMALLFQAWGAFSSFPYYFTYRSPILYSAGNAYPNFPYGEGLELAAQYLAELPGAKDSSVLSYYGRGCFSYYYPGETVGFRPYWIDGAHTKDLLSAIQSADYLVIYNAAQGQSEKYEKYLAILSGAQPLHEVWMDGAKYATIYKVDELPQNIYEALSNL
ncbi:MAG: glycosyltransferase family 39 protein [Chloroflexi bacterium]|nr:glycosyltransferase family 39 protein [Chloroflexota bacterium]